MLRKNDKMSLYSEITKEKDMRKKHILLFCPDKNKKEDAYEISGTGELPDGISSE